MKGLSHITITRLGLVTLHYRSGPHIDTRRSLYLFDWSQVAKCCPVVDLRGCTDVDFWGIANKDHPSVAAKLEACRRAGIRVTTVRWLKEAA
ncbi:MAG: hypothetical protein ABFE13_12200 [Phycisphaerales bacterium]